MNVAAERRVYSAAECSRVTAACRIRCAAISFRFACEFLCCSGPMPMWSLRHMDQVLDSTGTFRSRHVSGICLYIATIERAGPRGLPEGSNGLVTGANGERGGSDSGQDPRLLSGPAQTAEFPGIIVLPTPWARALTGRCGRCQDPTQGRELARQQRFPATQAKRRGESQKDSSG